MPRPKTTGRSKDYNPTTEEVLWLTGKPLPEEIPGIIRRELGLPQVRIGWTVADEQDCNPFGIMALDGMESRAVKRMRVLYRSAPEHIRRRVPPARKALLESDAPDADTWAAFREEAERIDAGRNYTVWDRMSDDERKEVIDRAVRRKPEYGEQ